MKVKEFATVVNGATPSSKCPEYYDGDIAWFTPKDLSDQGTKYVSVPERYITQEGYDSCSTSMLPAGSVLMSSRAPIGLLAISTVPCCTNQGFKSFNVDTKKCDSEYLYYYLKHHIKEIEALGSGTTFKEVSKESVENYDVFLPDVDIQKSLVKVLSEIDSKISNNTAICSDLESMAKLLYDYWFVQFDFPDENGKPYKSSGGKMVWNEELKREIPLMWNNGKISDLGEIVGGGTPSTKHEEYYAKKGIAWATPKDLADSPNRFFTHGERDISDTGLQNSSAVLMPCGTVLMTSRAPIGYLAISKNEVSTNQGFKSIIPDKRFGADYVYFTLDLLMPYIKNYGTGSTFSEISKSDLESIPTIIPDTKTLSRFIQKVQPITDLIYNLEEENKQLASLRDFLLPMLMNGQVKVKKEDDNE